MHAQLCCIPDVKKSRAIVRKTFAVSHLKDSKVCDCFQEAVCDKVERASGVQT